MPEVKLFTEPVQGIKKVLLSQSNSEKLGLPKGGEVQLVDEETGRSINAPMEVSDDVLDFSCKVDIEFLNQIEYDSIEIVIRPVSQADTTMDKAIQDFAAVYLTIHE